MVLLLFGDNTARLVPQLAALRVERLGLIEVGVRQLKVATVGDLAGAAHVPLRGLLPCFGIARSNGLLITPVAGLLAGGLLCGELVGDGAVFFVTLRLGLARCGWRGG